MASIPLDLADLESGLVNAVLFRYTNVAQLYLVGTGGEGHERYPTLLAST